MTAQPSTASSAPPPCAPLSVAEVSAIRGVARLVLDDPDRLHAVLSWLTALAEHPIGPPELRAVAQDALTLAAYAAATQES